MNLKAYANAVTSLAEKYPTAKVIYASDDEGNHFEEVHFAPGFGCFDGHTFYPFDGKDFKVEKLKVNAVCVN